MDNELTTEDVRRLVGPAAERNKMAKIWLFRGDGLMLCIRPAADCGIMQMSGFMIEAKRAFGHDIGIIPERDLLAKMGPKVVDRLEVVFSSGST